MKILLFSILNTTKHLEDYFTFDKSFKIYLIWPFPLNSWLLYITNIHYKILSVLRLCNKGVQLVPGNSLGLSLMLSTLPSGLSRIHILLSEIIANSLSLASFLASVWLWDCVMVPVDLTTLTRSRSLSLILISHVYQVCWVIWRLDWSSDRLELICHLSALSQPSAPRLSLCTCIGSEEW